ncbi:uncharacterized protein LOC128208237 [Mya arenaria]|uniref:uncharacterized protein LOC128208237 n=1 Tax=Mya arenaria TaxID=6604 RepID=UPI0022E09ECC|nr:uncharacterized protein LOC128208237 [Mya arenaria]
MSKARPESTSSEENEMSDFSKYKPDGTENYTPVLNKSSSSSFLNSVDSVEMNGESEVIDEIKQLQSDMLTKLESLDRHFFSPPSNLSGGTSQMNETVSDSNPHCKQRMSLKELSHENFLNISDEIDESFSDLEDGKPTESVKSQESQVYNYILDLESSKASIEVRDMDNDDVELFDENQDTESYSLSTSFGSEDELRDLTDDISVDSDDFFNRIVEACGSKQALSEESKKVEQGSKMIKNAAQTDQSRTGMDAKLSVKQPDMMKSGTADSTVNDADLNNNLVECIGNHHKQPVSANDVKYGVSAGIDISCSQPIRNETGVKSCASNDSRHDSATPDSLRISPELFQPASFSPSVVYGKDHVVGYQQYNPRLSPVDNSRSTLNTPDPVFFEDADSNDPNWFARLSQEIIEDPISTDTAFDANLGSCSMTSEKRYGQPPPNRLPFPTVPPTSAIESFMNQGRAPDISTWNAVSNSLQTGITDFTKKPTCTVPPSVNSFKGSSLSSAFNRGSDRMDTAIASNPFDDDFRNNNTSFMPQQTFHQGLQYIHTRPQPGMPTIWTRQQVPTHQHTCHLGKNQSTSLPHFLSQSVQPPVYRPSATYSLNFSSPVSIGNHYPVNFVSHPSYISGNVARPIPVHASNVVPLANYFQPMNHVTAPAPMSHLPGQSQLNYNGNSGMWSRTATQMSPQLTATRLAADNIVRTSDVNTNFQTNANVESRNSAVTCTAATLVAETNTTSEGIKHSEMVNNTFDDISTDDTSEVRDMSIDESIENRQDVNETDKKNDLNETAGTENDPGLLDVNNNRPFDSVSEMKTVPVSVSTFNQSGVLKTDFSKPEVNLNNPTFGSSIPNTSYVSVQPNVGLSVENLKSVNKVSCQGMPFSTGMQKVLVNMSPIGSLPAQVPAHLKIPKQQFSELYVKRGSYDISGDIALDLCKKKQKTGTAVNKPVTASGASRFQNIRPIAEPAIPVSALLNNLKIPAFSYDGGMLVPYMNSIFTAMADFKRKQDIITGTTSAFGNVTGIHVSQPQTGMPTTVHTANVGLNQSGINTLGGTSVLSCGIQNAGQILNTNLQMEMNQFLNQLNQSRNIPFNLIAQAVPGWTGENLTPNTTDGSTCTVDSKPMMSPKEPAVSGTPLLGMDAQIPVMMQPGASDDDTMPNQSALVDQNNNNNCDQSIDNIEGSEHWIELSESQNNEKAAENDIGETEGGRRRKPNVVCMSACCNDEVTEQELRKIRSVDRKQLNRRRKLRKKRQQRTITPILSAPPRTSPTASCTLEQVAAYRQMPSTGQGMSASVGQCNMTETAGQPEGIGQITMFNQGAEQEYSYSLGTSALCGLLAVEQQGTYANTERLESLEAGNRVGGNQTGGLRVPKVLWEGRDRPSAVHKVAVQIQGNSMSSTQPVVNKGVSVYNPVTQNMKFMLDDKKEDFKARHYNFTRLRIGTYQYSCIGNQTYDKIARVKILFKKRMLVYEFQLNKEAGIAKATPMAEILVPLDSIVAMWAFERDLRVEVNAVPMMHVGTKECLLARSRATVYNRSNCVDLTHDQISQSPYHFVQLRAFCAVKVRALLCKFEPRFEEMFMHPLVEDPSRCLMSQPTSQLVDPSIKIPTSYSGLACPVYQPQSSPAAGSSKEVCCTCSVGCSDGMCECCVAGATCTEGLCACAGCKNPLNILHQMGLPADQARTDPCLMENIYQIAHLAGYVQTPLILECCGTSTILFNCIPGIFTCPKTSCNTQFMYSWCNAQLCREDGNPRNHCLSCARCTDHRNQHCSVCNVCYFAGVCRTFKCPNCHKGQKVEFSSSDLEFTSETETDTEG